MIFFLDAEIDNQFRDFEKQVKVVLELLRSSIKAGQARKPQEALQKLGMAKRECVRLPMMLMSIGSLIKDNKF